MSAPLCQLLQGSLQSSQLCAKTNTTTCYQLCTLQQRYIYITIHALHLQLAAELPPPLLHRHSLSNHASTASYNP